MREIKADVWVLTETHSAVSPGRGYSPIATSSSSSELVAGEAWVTIWSRLPLAHENRTTDSVYSASATVVTESGAELAIFGTVLPWRGRSWEGLPSAGAVAFAGALRRQQGDWQRLRRGARAMLCVVGDFNQDLSPKPYYWSRKAHAHLGEALAESDLTACTAAPMDPVRRLTNGDAACIDHICLPSSVAELVSAPTAWSPVVAGKALSDHPGIYVDLNV